MDRRGTVQMLTPEGTGGISIFEIVGADAMSFLAPYLHPHPEIRTGALNVCRIMNEGEMLDEVVIAQYDIHRIHINCHGGTAIREAIRDWLECIGFQYLKKQVLEATSLLSISERALDSLPVARTLSAAHSLLAQTSGLNEQHLRSALHRVADKQLSLPKLKSEWDDYVLRSKALIQLLNPATVVIAGLPNAGKSSLFNMVLGKDRALISSQAGTTIDSLTAMSNFIDVPVHLSDTPGYRQEGSEVEILGIALGKEHVKKADHTIYLIDHNIGMQKEDKKLLESMDSQKVTVALSKCDEDHNTSDKDRSVFRISIHRSESLEPLLKHIAGQLVHGLKLPIKKAALFCEGDIQVALEIQSLLHQSQPSIEELISLIKNLTQEK